MNETMKHKHRSAEEIKDLTIRLNRIEGQIRGIKTMVEEERYCVDILNQVTAVQAALNAFNRNLLISHINSCVVEELRQGNEDIIAELCTTLQRIMK